MEQKRRQLLKGISIFSAGFLLDAFASGEKAFGKELEKKTGGKSVEEVTASCAFGEDYHEKNLEEALGFV